MASRKVAPPSNANSPMGFSLAGPPLGLRTQSQPSFQPSLGPTLEPDDRPSLEDPVKQKRVRHGGIEDKEEEILFAVQPHSTAPLRVAPSENVNSLQRDVLTPSSSQQNNNAAGSLFGGVAAQSSQAQQTTSLFGNTQASQPAQSSGLFGSAQTSQPQQSGGLFGNTQTSQPQQSGGLFGNTQTSQPAQSGGLFSNLNQTSQPQQSGSLFGNTQNNNQTGSGTSLFGSSTQNNTQGGGLFGGTTSGQQAAGNSLFGNMQNQQQATSAGNLFGNNTNSNPQPQNSNLFGGTGGNNLFGNKTVPFGALNSGNNNNNNGNNSNQQQTNNNPGSSIFGLNAVPREQLNQTLLPYSQHRQASTAPFAGSLSMGQGNAASDSNAAVGAVKVDLGDLRTTTRFQDLIDPLKEQFERADKMIAQQEEFCKKIESFKLVHEQNVKTVAPDVQHIRQKVEATESLLKADAQAVMINKKTVEKDRRDFDRCQRIVENLGLPSSYHLSNLSYGQSLSSQRLANPAGTEGDDTYDIDVIGNYFNPMVADLQRTIAAYTANLSEIEEHMKVIESSAVTQAHQLAAQRAGTNMQQDEESNIRVLADTLRGFEDTILNVAGEVGVCREGVTDLVMGRVENGRPASARGTRAW